MGAVCGSGKIVREKWRGGWGHWGHTHTWGGTVWGRSRATTRGCTAQGGIGDGRLVGPRSGRVAGPICRLGRTTRVVVRAVKQVCEQGVRGQGDN